MSNKLVTMAREILEIEADFPFRLNYLVDRRPGIDDFDLYTFEQIWGSTALGFGGIGGQALTEARTYVFVPVGVNQKCLVYFAGRFAYAVEYSDILMEDINKKQIASVAMSGKYKIKE